MRTRLLRPTLSLSMATLLAISSQGLAVAQTSSAGLVGVGGRVEVAEAGYALTLPDGWAYVVVTGGDVSPILEEVSNVLPEFTGLVESFLAGGADFSLLAFGPAGPDEDGGVNCNVIDRPSEGLTLDQKVAGEVEGMHEFGDLLASGPEVTDLDRASGPASRIDIGLIFPDVEPRSSSYVLTDGTVFHTLTCTDLTRPDDYWLSIVETFEFLPNAG